MFFRKKEIQYTSQSLGKEAWRKLKKNKTAMFGMFFIIFVTLLSVMSYIISPDNSPNANTQILEINKKKPGFSITLLKVKKNEPENQDFFFKKLFMGFPNDYSYFPVKSWKFDSIFIEVEQYSGYDDIEGNKSRFLISNVAYSVCDSCPVSSLNGELFFTDFYGEKHNVPVKKIQEEINTHLLEKKKYLLGTDTMGRDFLSRLIIGSRVSLSVGLISVLISLLLGVWLGVVAGYYRGWVDNAVMWLINVIWSVPTLLLVIAITFALGKGFWQIFIAVGLTMWVEVARIVRGQVLGIREKEYVEAARALGFGNMRIIFRHILPNTMAPVIVISAANFASAILLEAGLSFLGIGVQPPMPSWGSMIKDHYGYIVMDYAYLAIIPGICIALLVLSFMLLGNGLRDALDVRTVEKQ